MRPTLRTLGLLSAILSTAAGCQTAETSTTQRAAFAACAPELPPVRTVADVQGIVHFDQQLKQYRLDAPQPGTVDEVAVGVVCGALPPAYQKEGYKVVFSGAYKAYANPPSLPGGYTVYHLELTKLQASQP